MTSHVREVQGVSVPAFCYGTAWKEDATEDLTTLALKSGFRAIDTANQRRHYFEAGVGSALAKARATGLTREDLFLQTKFTYARGQDHRLPYDPEASFATQVAQSFASSLEHLGVSHLDSYVLHGPATGRGLTRADWEVWRAMEGLVAEKQARLLGVSNVAPDQLALLLRDAEVKPAFVQNRCFARDGWDREVRALCREHDVIYQGFSLLTANGREIHGPTIDAIMQRRSMTRAQVVFRFALDVGMMPLTGTSSAEHMQEDLACLGMPSLEPDDVRAIENLAG
jgi:diketogulonate reductase-like aldo/keto reductase